MESPPPSVMREVPATPATPGTQFSHEFAEWLAQKTAERKQLLSRVQRVIEERENASLYGSLSGSASRSVLASLRESKSPSSPSYRPYYPSNTVSPLGSPASPSVFSAVGTALSPPFDATHSSHSTPPPPLSHPGDTARDSDNDADRSGFTLTSDVDPGELSLSPIKAGDGSARISDVDSDGIRGVVFGAELSGGHSHGHGHRSGSGRKKRRSGGSGSGGSRKERKSGGLEMLRHGMFPSQLSLESSGGEESLDSPHSGPSGPSGPSGRRSRSGTPGSSRGTPRKEILVVISPESKSEIARLEAENSALREQLLEAQRSSGGGAEQSRMVIRSLSDQVAELSGQVETQTEMAQLAQSQIETLTSEKLKLFVEVAQTRQETLSKDEAIFTLQERVRALESEAQVSAAAAAQSTSSVADSQELEATRRELESATSKISLLETKCNEYEEALTWLREVVTLLRKPHFDRYVIADALEGVADVSVDLSNVSFEA